MSYYESKEHEELEKHIEEIILKTAKMICETYGKGEHPNELENIAYHLRSARSFGYVLGQSYMLREQYNWSKEDLGYSLADTIHVYFGNEVSFDDLAPKK